MPTDGKPLIGVNTSPVLKKVYALLKPDGDLTTPGEWFDHEKILLEAMTVITPAQAIRFAEQERASQFRKMNGEVRPRKKHADDYDWQVASGARSMTRQRIWGSAHIAFRMVDGVKQIRFEPGAGRCTRDGKRVVRNTGIDPKHRNRLAQERAKEFETVDRNAGEAHGDPVSGADDAADPSAERG